MESPVSVPVQIYNELYKLSKSMTMMMHAMATQVCLRIGDKLFNLYIGCIFIV